MGDPVKNRAVHLPGDRQRAAGKGCGQERHQRGQTRSSPPPAPPGTPGRSRAAAGHGRSPGAGRRPGRRRDGRRDQDGPGAGAGSAAPRLSTETRAALSLHRAGESRTGRARAWARRRLLVRSARDIIEVRAKAVPGALADLPYLRLRARRSRVSRALAGLRDSAGSAAAVQLGSGRRCTRRGLAQTRPGPALPPVQPHGHRWCERPVRAAMAALDGCLFAGILGGCPGAW